VSAKHAHHQRARMPNLLKSAPKVFASGSVYNKLLVEKVSASNYDRLQPEKKKRFCSQCENRILRFAIPYEKYTIRIENRNLTAMQNRRTLTGFKFSKCGLAFGRQDSKGQQTLHKVRKLYGTQF